MNLERIHEIAEGELLGKRSHSWKEPGNKLHHGERVARIALELRRAIAARRRIFLCHLYRERRIRKVILMPMDQQARSPSLRLRCVRAYPWTGAGKSTYAQGE